MQLTKEAYWKKEKKFERLNEKLQEVRKSIENFTV